MMRNLNLFSPDYGSIENPSSDIFTVRSFNDLHPGLWAWGERLNLSRHTSVRCGDCCTHIRSIMVQTKSSLVLRDFDIISLHRDAADVGTTITTTDRSMSRKIMGP